MVLGCLPPPTHTAVSDQEGSNCSAYAELSCLRMCSLSECWDMMSGSLVGSTPNMPQLLRLLSGCGTRKTEAVAHLQLNTGLGDG
jgi:hypothetical protein